METPKFEQVTPVEFITEFDHALSVDEGVQVNCSDAGAAVTGLGLGGHRFFAEETTGLAGFAIDSDGELCFLFNIGPAGWGAAAVRYAIKMGATWLNCYEHLRRFFERGGFTVSRWEVNRDDPVDGEWVAYMEVTQERLTRVLG